MDDNNPGAQVAPTAHAVLPIDVQMQLRAAAIRCDLRAIDAITDAMVRAGLARPRSDCQWMTRAEIVGALQGQRAR